jgi:ribonuclease HI
VRVLPSNTGARLIVYTDGAARGNPGPAGLGVHVTSEDGRTVRTLAEGIGPATNNVAEYRAAIAGLQLAAKLGAREVLLRADSRLLIEQLAGRFRVKNPTLRVLHQAARELMQEIGSVDLEHVPREENSEADALANEGVEAWLAENAWEPPGPDPSLFEH